MSTTTPFDPEVHELLREAVADPDSILFRVPKEKISSWAGRSEERVTPMSPGLSKVERHLVSVYRDEVGQLLAEACWRCLMTAPQNRTLFHKRPFAPLASLKQRASSLPVDLVPCAEDLSVLRLFLAGAGVSSLALVTSAIRVAPRAELQLYLAQFLFLANQCLAARRAVSALLAREAAPPMKSFAFMSLAGFCFRKEDIGGAHGHYLRSMEHDERRVPPLLNALGVSLMLMDKEAAVLASNHLDAVDLPEAAVAEYLGIIRAAKDGGLMRGLGYRQSAMGRFADRLSPISERIANVIA